ncbi:MAG: recombinase family protein [Carboxylicivirga sp.]|jgi:DNA invertase Pin-like site-specific DNA recombinase|nr:recombinase family protein [Carboxylicivirga sp.]
MKALIYRRVSTDSRKQDIQRQLAPIEKYCLTNNLEIIGDYYDEISGTIRTEDREGYKKLLTHVENYPNKRELNIVFDQISRIGRKRKIILDAIELFTEQRINVHFLNPQCVMLNDDGTVNKMADTIITLFAQFAQNERDELVHKIQTSISRTAAKGHHLGGRQTLYGYKSENKKLVVDDKEAEVVRSIFRMYESGIGTTKIANYLNSKEIPTRNNSNWKGSVLQRMLKNRTYIGEREVKVDEEKTGEFRTIKSGKNKGEKVEIVKPIKEVFSITSIVEKDLFDKVQDIFRSKVNYSTVKRKNVNPLIRRLYCRCGKPIFVQNSASQGGLIYRCSSIHHQAKCDAFSTISYDKLNNSIVTLFENIVGKENENTKRLAELEIELRHLDEIEIPLVEVKINNYNDTIERIYDAYVSGVYSKEKRDRMVTKLDEDTKEHKERFEAFNGRVKEIKKQIRVLNDNQKVDSVIDIHSFKSFAQNNVEKVEISKMSRPDELTDVYKRKDEKTLFKVSVRTVRGDNFSYLLSNRSDVLVFEWKHKKITITPNNKWMREAPCSIRITDAIDGKWVLRQDSDYFYDYVPIKKVL